MVSWKEDDELEEVEDVVVEREFKPLEELPNEEEVIEVEEEEEEELEMENSR